MTAVPKARFDPRAFPPGVQESTWHAADGWPIRRVDWPVRVPHRGALLFLPGRADFLEKYLETLDRWSAAGWAVTALDWRGQALSGRLGRGDIGHVDDFAVWLDDLAGFWGEWSATAPGPHVLVAHSMGGHLALRAVAERRVKPDALVLSAPMLGLLPQAVPPALLHLAARAMCALGDPQRPAWRASEKPGAALVDRSALLTHDAARYADEAYWRATRPALGMGPASWGWVRAALGSIRRIDRREALAGVSVPVFIAATTADHLVAFAAIDRAARWLPRVELLRLGPEARHELLREVDAVREPVLAAIDEFLDRVAPAGN